MADPKLQPPVPHQRTRDRTSAADSARAIVDLFAGIGCVARGFADAGFGIAALVDVDAGARDTYLHNYSDANYVLRDVSELTSSDVESLDGGVAIAGVVGCPPCQGFSAAGPRDGADPRNLLLRAFFHAIDLISPLFYVMENVPSVVYESELARLLSERESQWMTCVGVLNGACYGLPQTRQRAIVIGYRRELARMPTLPVPTHFGTRPVFNYRNGEMTAPTSNSVEALLGESPHIGVPHAERKTMSDLLPADSAALLDLVTVADAIADLPALAEDRATTPPSAYAQQLLNGDVAHNHEPWGHRRKTIEKLASVPEGGRLDTDRPYFSQAYARLHRYGLARTLTTNFHNAGCGRFTHYAEPRTLTVREAARLQGIPDSFEFVYDRSLQERLAGNAFPQLWARSIASHLAAELGDFFDAV